MNIIFDDCCFIYAVKQAGRFTDEQLNLIRIRICSHFLSSNEMVDIIPHCCRVDKSCVKITYYVDEDITCCSIASKINPAKEIQIIQIFKNYQNLGLMFNFNGVYNQINDEFKISLQRVLVSVQPIAYV